MMLFIRKKLLPRLGLTLCTALFFVVGLILYAAKTHDATFLTFLIHFGVFCGLPLLIFSFYKKVKTVKELLVSSLINSIWVATPPSLFWGWLVAIFPLNEFDTSGFDFPVFISIFLLTFVLFVSVAYVLLVAGGGLQLLRAKRLKNIKK